MRYVLLFSDGSINVGINDEKSKYLVWGKKGWRSAVTELTAMVRRRHEGRIVNLEIQSHGKPGAIVAPPHNITNDNVAQFGGMLRAVMAPGGLIEVMACSVASVSDRTFRSTVETQKNFHLRYSPDVLDAYFGGLDKDPVFLRKDDVTLHSSVTRFEGERLARVRKTIADWSKLPMSYSDNGLEFCLTLARTSGAIVRASSLTQAEEYGDIWDGNQINPTYTTDHFIMRDYDRFGDWEGPVWDFMPNGTVKYLGCSIARHKLRLPVHPVPSPQQLTYNFREQGGNNADVGQRPQRINRNPLPV